jgi:hypothetical protein
MQIQIFQGLKKRPLEFVWVLGPKEKGNKIRVAYLFIAKRKGIPGRGDSLYLFHSKKKRLLGSSNRPGSKKLLKGGTYKKEHWTLLVFLTGLSENMLPIQNKGTGIVQQTKHLVTISWSQYRSTKPNMLSHQSIKISKYHETPGSAKGDSRDHEDL